MENMITRESVYFTEMVSKMQAVEKGMEALLSADKSRDKWIDGAETLRRLRISKRTLQNYRDDGTLPYSKVGGKIYYNTDDLEILMRKNYVSGM